MAHTTVSEPSRGWGQSIAVRVWLPWLFLVLVLVCRLPLWTSMFLGDFKVYYSGGQWLAQGQPVYDMMVHTGGTPPDLPFTYPLFAAVLAVPLGWLPFPAAVAIFLTMSVAALIGSCYLAARAIPAIAGRASVWSTRELVAMILAAGLLLGPVVSMLYLGQVGSILMFLVLADFLLLRRSQGVLTGIAAGIKVTPLVFVALYAASRKWRQVIVAALTFLITVAIGWIVQSAQAKAYWTQLLFDTSRVGDTDRPDNVSLLGVLTRADPATAKQIWLPLAVIVFLAGLYLATKWFKRSQLIAVLVMGLIIVIISPISWTHHLVWLVIALPVTVALAVRGFRQRDRLSGYFCTLTVALMLFVSVINPDTIGYRMVGAHTNSGFGYELLTGLYLLVTMMTLIAFSLALRIYPPAVNNPPEEANGLIGDGPVDDLMAASVQAPALSMQASES